MEKISLTMKVGEILEEYPETLEVFKANGFAADKKEDLLEELGPQLMLKTALKVKELNGDLFLHMLEEKIKEKQASLLFQDENAMRRLNFLGYTYCPLKQTFKDSFEEILKKYLAETGNNSFQYCVPSGCGGEDTYDNIWQVEKIEDFPDILVSAGFDDFFRQGFVDRLVKKGYFKSKNYSEMNSDFVSLGYEDPDGWYSPYAAAPLVWLVDHKKLGSLPKPKEWKDLLNPIYKDNIVVGSCHDEVHEDVLLYFYKEYGDEGVRKLAANVKGGLHGAQMAKLAGSNRPQGAAIYLIPWLFAKSCPRTEVTEIIWPEDGAIIVPMYLLIKEGKDKEFATFLDFVMGTDYGQKSADNCFPVLNPQVDNKLPNKAGFKWLGWDYIKSHPMEELIDHVVNIFNQSLDKQVGQLGAEL